MKPKNTWIVITDGARSRILLNTGPGKGVEEVPDTDIRAPHPKSREISNDRPGRSFESADGSRHGYQSPTDPAEKNETDFVKKLAKFLDQSLADEKYDRVIIAADPKSLGHIRGFLTKAVQAQLLGDLAKDLTKISNADIPSHFDQFINM